MRVSSTVGGCGGRRWSDQIVSSDECRSVQRSLPLALADCLSANVYVGSVEGFGNRRMRRAALNARRFHSLLVISVPGGGAGERGGSGSSAGRGGFGALVSGIC